MAADNNSPADTQADLSYANGVLFLRAVVRRENETGRSARMSIDRCRFIGSMLAEAGFAIVPVEPTEAMQTAGAYQRENRHPVENIWRAMIGAAQK